jgi:hypothetical protein
VLSPVATEGHSAPCQLLLQIEVEPTDRMEHGCTQTIAVVSCHPSIRTGRIIVHTRTRMWVVVASHTSRAL